MDGSRGDRWQGGIDFGRDDRGRSDRSGRHDGSRKDGKGSGWLGHGDVGRGEDVSFDEGDGIDGIRYHVGLAESLVCDGDISVFVVCTRCKGKGFVGSDFSMEVIAACSPKGKAAITDRSDEVFLIDDLAYLDEHGIEVAVDDVDVFALSGILDHQTVAVAHSGAGVNHGTVTDGLDGCAFGGGDIDSKVASMALISACIVGPCSEYRIDEVIGWVVDVVIVGSVSDDGEGNFAVRSVL